MKKIVVDERYAGLNDFIQAIEYQFEQGTDWIRQARNEIKRFKVDEHDLCIKAFRKATVFNKWMYSYFRKSKARRSYECAQQLIKIGVNTPAPVAYVEEYNRWHFLLHSYYICKFEAFEYDIANVLTIDVAEKRPILRDFVHFMVNELHAVGIRHKDFNGTNVLVRRVDAARFQFLLIDLNRLKFGRPLGYHQGLFNMQQISSNPEYLTELARFYARFKNADADDTVYKLLFLKSLMRLKRRYTKRFLHSLKTILQ